MSCAKHNKVFHTAHVHFSVNGRQTPENIQQKMTDRCNLPKIVLCSIKYRQQAGLRLLNCQKTFIERDFMKKIRSLTAVSILHYIRLIYRSILFLAVLFAYFTGKLDEIGSRPMIMVIIWVVFVVEMILRFFPSKLESPGCQKQFAGNYIKTGRTDIVIPDNHATVLVALTWIIFNGLIGFLKMADFLDDGFMILLSCAYSVCDMICILFFCPFQTWFLKNKCCSTCRIYNWDYAMMFTPLFFVKSAFSWSLLILAAALLLRWEIAIYRYPERFSENTNEYLHCENCTEKLCTHKKQLRTLWQTISEVSKERMKKLQK